MNKWYLFALCLCGTYAFADVTVELSQGYRRDNLRFAVSGPQGSPDVLSELHFKHMDVYMTHIRLQLSHNDYFLRLQGAYGDILNGSIHDSDYIGNHRTFEISHSIHQTSGDYTLDIEVYAGKRFQLPYEMTIAPMIGYGYYKQHLRLKHGMVAFERDPFTGHKLRNIKIHGLNSTYRANWYSPQLGVELTKQATARVQLFLDYFFLYPLAFRAHGYWNLREPSARHFEDKGKATKSFGHIATFGGKYQFTRHWQLVVEYELMKFYEHGGHAYYDGHATNPLKSVHRTSNELRLSVGYTF